MFPLHFLLVVLQFQVLYLNLYSILTSFHMLCIIRFQFHLSAYGYTGLPNYFMKRYPFPIVCSCHLCWRTIDWKYMDAVLGFLFCYLVYMFIFIPVPCCIIYSNFVIYFKIKQCDTSSFVLLYQGCFS